MVSAHVRSLMPDHLIDVVSTDKHTVKPWFAGHTDVSPVVADFEAQGFRLIGDAPITSIISARRGRLPARRALHQCVQLAGNERIPSAEVTRNGYHLAFWKAGKSRVLRPSPIRVGRTDGLGALASRIWARATRGNKSTAP